MKTKLLRKVRKNVCLSKVIPPKGEVYYRVDYSDLIELRSTSEFKEALKTFHAYVQVEYDSYIKKHSERRVILP